VMTNALDRTSNEEHVTDDYEAVCWLKIELAN
jgi:hypothetical protein